jgi:hypothetical protein
MVLEVQSMVCGVHCFCASVRQDIIVEGHGGAKFHEAAYFMAARKLRESNGKGPG